MTRTKKLIFATTGIIILGVIAYGLFEYRTHMNPPISRLKPGGYYEEMPSDSHHIYIQLPLDHFNQASGTYTAFYLLSPSFNPEKEPVFQIYDNQQEMVGMIRSSADFEPFDDRIGRNKSYVLIGNRGVSPTLFPEVFKKDGKPDYGMAMNLYGSQQQIEDIESVRLDLLKRGLLKGEGKIMLYGGSGGGVLIQQYLDKYGEHVSRVLLESTGAMDLSRMNNSTFIRSQYDSNKEAAGLYFQLYTRKKTSPSLAWLVFKLGLDGRTDLQNKILEAKNAGFNPQGEWLWFKNWINPAKNYPLISSIFRFPSELEVKVRIWEVSGYDLVNYHPKSAEEIIPLYEVLQSFLKEFLEAYRKGEIGIFNFSPDRSTFKGEVLIFANTGDQDFGPAIAKQIGEAYPNSRLLIFDENAHHKLKKDASQMQITEDFFMNGLH